ncbi:hypothetical protein AAV94_14000 [Lampropedia cohaerens]|uniref:Uncharacterized protein n=1 Tax=Lampropedia cohaerens TaxID=1610491 RepID=A0A0U1PWD6_9BURK|nr:hypothetical protein AAV94_14000 [Lampropedia cohaerens]
MDIGRAQRQSFVPLIDLRSATSAHASQGIAIECLEASSRAALVDGAAHAAQTQVAHALLGQPDPGFILEVTIAVLRTRGAEKAMFQLKECTQPAAKLFLAPETQPAA